MIRTVAARLATLVVLVWVVSLAVFALVLLIPGDPTTTLLGDNATPEQVTALRTSLGLDDPLLERYWRWLSGALRGDLGTSMLSSYPVTQAIGDRIGMTVSLVVSALVLSVVVGLVIGVLAAVRQGGWFDRLTLLDSSIGIAMPNFWLGLVLVTFFGAELGLFPTSGYASPLLPWSHALRAAQAAPGCIIRRNVSQQNPWRTGMRSRKTSTTAR